MRHVIVALLLLLAVRPAGAVTLTLVSEKKPWTGVIWRHYTTKSPTTHTWVALFDLCASNVHVAATKAKTATQTTAKWASGEGVKVATNGDFYKAGPARVYGDAVGDGVPWPLAQTGLATSASAEWYFQKYGWIAFGYDWVEYTHSKQVKKGASPPSTGWSPGKVGPAAPPGTIALVSGFPELVIDGAKVTCSSPTASSCFPDRSDMRDRHPRTAMGLTKDKKTFILAVVDGRTTKSQGMYGTELADLMAKLGANVAFNLDGGGSSQMWVSGQSYVNDYSGNNSGGGARSMANHWGVFAGSGKPKRPGHCVASAPCQVVPAAGGTVDDSSACFQTFGPDEYWRTEATGNGGGLHWTNAWKTSAPGNWAFWQLHLAEAGTYRVEYNAVKPYAVHKAVHYEVRAGGKTTKLTVDQSKGSGWTKLAEVPFSAGGGQWVAVYDDSATTVAADQHVLADAIRLVRTGAWCGNATCDAGESCGSCGADCGACPTCGDGACNGTETCGTCAPDCGSCVVCGDGACDGTETCGSCAPDCGACVVCGDGACDGGEDCGSCSLDCGGCVDCGDGVCQAEEGCAGCPSDCGACAACGDGTCDEGEGCGSCPGDCGACEGVCGDGLCDESESCSGCADDCGGCDGVCGDGSCNEGEGCASCPGDCGACPPCGDGVCEPDEACAACPSDCGPCGSCGDGACDGDESCSACPADCGSCTECGDGECGEGESCLSCPSDCGACTACGDGICGPGEECASCPVDCGACGACGNGACGTGEDCVSCPGDCGACQTCGDGVCAAPEDCASCASDCGGCPDSGDAAKGGADTSGGAVFAPDSVGVVSDSIGGDSGCRTTARPAAAPLLLLIAWAAMRRHRRPRDVART